MSKGNLKSRIFDKNLDVEKEIEEWAKKIKECGETTGHEYKWSTINLFSNIRRPTKVGSCKYCGHRTARELTLEEKEEAYMAREEARKAQYRHVMK